MRLIDSEFLEQEINKWINCPVDGKHYCGWDDALTAVLDLIVDMPIITLSNDCEYCSGEPMRPLDWQYGLDHIFPDYKYCPMCGRYLKGKNENECK